MKITCIAPNGERKESQIPPSASQALIDQMIRQLERAGFSDIQLVGEQSEVKSGRFISPDEQRAATTAVEAEQHYGSHCPDCGRKMESDGGYLYCEYCEG